jgi:hypothetical protein
MSKVKVGDKYIVPKGTELWFSQLLQKYITTKDYVIVVTHTTTDNNVIYGDLHEVTFPITIPGLRKIIRGATSVNLDQVEPIGDLLKPNMWEFKYNGNDEES